MNKFQSNDGDARRPAGHASSTEASSDASALFNYPSLGRLFESPDTRPLEDMRARLSHTSENLERVIRQGTRADADRAALAARAYSATLSLLDTLERMRKEGAR